MTIRAYETMKRQGLSPEAATEGECYYLGVKALEGRIPGAGLKTAVELLCLAGEGPQWIGHLCRLAWSEPVPYEKIKKLWEKYHDTTRERG